MLKSLTSRKLKFLRKLKKETQVSLAEKVGVNYRHLQKLESGEVDIKITTLEKLAGELKVPVCYMLESVPNHSLESIRLPCPAALLDALHVGVVVLDLDGLIVYCNEFYARTIERTKEEIISKLHVYDMVPDPKQAEAVKRHLQIMKETKPEPIPYRRRHKTKDGKEYDLVTSSNYLFDHENRVIGHLCITQKEELNAGANNKFISPESLAACLNS